MATMIDILNKLLERTQADKVAWKPTTDEDTFIALVGDLSIVIDMDWRGIGSDIPTLKVLPKRGRVVDWINVDTPQGSVHKSNLDNLYRMARRCAFGSDSELDGLLAALDCEP